MNHALELIKSWENSPYPSTKISTYFFAYAELFSQYRNTSCVFIETGILGGGSLFMWREWLGPEARIIGIDLNPAANKWKDFGFEIYIGDQGDPDFWNRTLKQIGEFDVLLDDGGHQSFQQIVTTTEALRHASNKCIIAIEDTHTSFMNDFKAHQDNTFLKFAKDSTDIITVRGASMYPGRIKPPNNIDIFELYKNIYSIQFFNSLVAFKLDPINSSVPTAVWNKRENTPSDYRYHGLNKADTIWPDPFDKRIITIFGGQGN